MSGGMTNSGIASLAPWYFTLNIQYAIVRSSTGVEISGSSISPLPSLKESGWGDGGACWVSRQPQVAARGAAASRDAARRRARARGAAGASGARAGKRTAREHRADEARHHDDALLHDEDVLLAAAMGTRRVC